MAGRRAGRELSVRRVLSPQPMAAVDLEAAERLLAQLVARAFAADHPALFAPPEHGALAVETSGPSPAARADAGAPPARGGGPERMELEPHDSVVDTPP